MVDFPTRLKKLRKSKGLNQDELALALGVRKTTISNYETGYSKPTNTMMRQIAEYFDVAISELMGETLSLKEPLTVTGDAKQIAVYNALPVTGLIGTLPICYCTLPASLLGEGEFFALKLTDERMNRSHLNAGSLAIIRHQNYADDGDIALVRLHDSPPAIGRFYRSGNGFILSPDSDNSVYRPVIVNNAEDVFILGKVVQVLKTVL
ncbi:MAG: helix-turn-helix domain-containing protein [Ruminococcaceae bacterium]|nr:helix-turn-helix domain-containing protein [Oscillospiraceae bacterium]